jgi:hypothetical protein
MTHVLAEFRLELTSTQVSVMVSSCLRAGLSLRRFAFSWTDDCRDHHGLPFPGSADIGC